MSKDEIEASLESQIDPWLTHMRWRADFAEWRERRLWQENYQGQALEDMARYAGRISSELRILDIGAGMGGFAVAVALQMRSDRQDDAETARAPTGRVQPQSIVAMDYNQAYCEITRTRARRYDLDLPTLVGAGENLPFAGATFEIISCWDVVEHVQDPVKLLAEIARVLKPGGHAFITVINRLALVDPHYHLRFVNWVPRMIGEKYVALRQRTKDSPLRDRQRLGEMHYFTYGAAVALAARCGMSVQDVNAPRSRFTRLPSLVGSPLYLLWRTVGMGTFSLVLSKDGH